MTLRSVSVLTGIFLACGSSSDESSGLDTGLPAGTLLSELSVEDAKHACRVVEREANERLSREAQAAGLCELLITATSEDAATCRTETQQCIDDVLAGRPAAVPPEAFETVDEFDCENHPPTFVGCTSTVGELELCIEATLAQVESTFHRFTCDQAATIDPKDLNGLDTDDVELPAGCEQFMSDCALAP